MKRMSDRAIKVAVLGGDFAALNNLGSLSHKFTASGDGSEAIYCSVDCEINSSGFSVSLMKVSLWEGAKGELRLRPRYQVLMLLVNTWSPLLTLLSLSKSGITPIDAHPALSSHKSPTPKQSTAESESPAPDKSPSPASNQSTTAASTDESGAVCDGIDPTTCSNVDFEIRDGCPGVSYHHSENVPGWTPDGGESFLTLCCVISPRPSHVKNSVGINLTLAVQKMKNFVFQQVQMCISTSMREHHACR